MIRSLYMNMKINSVKNKGIKAFRRTIIVGIAASFLATADELIKRAIEKGKINNGVIEQTKGFAEIEKHHNHGFAMNRLDNREDIVTAVSVAACTGQTVMTYLTALSDEDIITNAINVFLLAGALSNTYDRVRFGYVVDYLKVGKKKRAIYNISDFFIFFGAILAIIRAICSKE